MGHDERARAWADRSSVAGCRWQYELQLRRLFWQSVHGIYASWSSASARMPYSAFDDNQQHVTHAATTENKRLSEVLA